MGQTKSSARTQQMYTLIRKYQSSDLTQKQFCEQENLARSTFQYWLNHYRKSHKAQSAPAFIPLPMPETLTPVSSGCSIRFPGDITIYFDRQPQAEFLIELISARDA